MKKLSFSQVFVDSISLLPIGRYCSSQYILLLGNSLLLGRPRLFLLGRRGSGNRFLLLELQDSLDNLLLFNEKGSEDSIGPDRVC